MKKTAIIIACGLALSFVGCEKVEKGMEGKKQAEEFREQAEKRVKDLQQLPKDIPGDEDKKNMEGEKAK